MIRHNVNIGLELITSMATYHNITLDGKYWNGMADTNVNELEKVHSIYIFGLKLSSAIHSRERARRREAIRNRRPTHIATGLVLFYSRSSTAVYPIPTKRNKFIYIYMYIGAICYIVCVSTMQWRHFIQETPANLSLRSAISKCRLVMR